MENKQNATVHALPEVAVRALHDGIGRDIALYRVSDNTVTDYHVLCTGRSNTHVRALADEVQYL